MLKKIAASALMFSLATPGLILANTDIEQEIPNDLIKLNTAGSLGGQSSAPLNTSKVKDGCRINIADDTLLYMVGAASGSDITPRITMGGSSGKAASSFRVAVNEPGKKVALFLSSQTPSVWSVSKTRGTDIDTVFLTGNGEQLINGLGSDVRVIESTTYNSETEDWRKAPCGTGAIAPGARLFSSSYLAYKIFGRTPSLAYLANHGVAYVGSPMANGQKLYAVDPKKPIDVILDKRKYKRDALKRLAESGKLTKINSKHPIIVEFAKARMAREEPNIPNLETGSGTIENYHSYLPSRRHHNTYIINEKVDLPPGLNGAFSARFYLPKGVSEPNGDLGHSVLLMLSSGECVSSSPSLCEFL